MTINAEQAHRDRSGLDDLTAVLSQPSCERGRDLWKLLEAHRVPAARHLGHVNGPLVAALRRGDRPDADVRSRLFHAGDLLLHLMRAIGSAPVTLTAITAGAPDPVAAREFAALAYSVHVAVTRMGLVPDEVTVRILTKAAVAAFARALAEGDAPVRPLLTTP